MTEQLDPQVYFDIIKDRKHTTTDKFLTDFQNVIELELSKAMKTGQNYLVRKLAYAKSIVIKERQLLEQDINVFVLREDIEEYIKKVEKKVVKVIELENYPRSIPDEVVQKLQSLKEQNIFDRYYIVFTDYTGEVEKTVKAEKRRKDPILFGAFEQKIDGVWDIFDRFYFIADWEDEYCDLTLSKMVDTMAKNGKDILHTSYFEAPTQEEVQAFINSLDEQQRDRFTLRPKKKSIFTKVRLATKSFIDEILG